MKLAIFLERKYNGKLFKNNQSKDQEASKIVINSRKREQETVRKKEEVWTREAPKKYWNVPGNLKYEGKERVVAGDEEDEVVNFWRMIWVTGWTFSEIWWVCLKIEVATFYCKRQRGSGGKTERRFDTRRTFTRRMEEEVNIKEMKIGMRKKGFEFSWDEIVKCDRKVSVNLPKL